MRNWVALKRISTSAKSPGSIFRNRDKTHWCDRRGAAGETGPQEFVDCVHVVGLHDVKHCVLRIGAITSEQL